MPRRVSASALDRAGSPSKTTATQKTSGRRECTPMAEAGGGAGDAIACGTSFLAAAAVGMLRVVSDQHYGSDVVTGAAVGSLIGLGIPWLLHYRGSALVLGDGSEGSGASEDSAGVTLGLVPGPTGAAFWGGF